MPNSTRDFRDQQQQQPSQHLQQQIVLKHDCVSICTKIK